MLVESDQLLWRVEFQCLRWEKRGLGGEGFVAVPGDKEICDILAAKCVDDVLDPISKEEMSAK